MVEPHGPGEGGGLAEEIQREKPLSAGTRTMRQRRSRDGIGSEGGDMSRSTAFALLSLGLLAMVGWAASPKKELETAGMNPETFAGLELRAIGPALMSGRIADIALDPDDPSIWYVAVGSGGVWKTANAGTTWTPVFDGQGAYSIGCVTVDPRDPNVVWVGTGENVGGRHVGFGDGVYRSLDGGTSWENLGLAAVRAHRQDRGRPARPEACLGGEPGAAVVAGRGPRPLPEHRPRRHLGQGARRRRVDRRHRPRDGPARPRGGGSRHLAAPALGGRARSTAAPSRASTSPPTAAPPGGG